MPENDDDDDNPLHLFGPGVKPLKARDDHVSRRSNTPLEIRLHRDPENFLAQQKRGHVIETSARQVDGRTAKKLRQGKITVEGRLDLHGYRYEAAREMLRHFIARAVQNGQRCVVVVTGKGDVGVGDGTQAPRGVIRRSLSTWLAEPPLDHLVLRAEVAKPEDGGVGAMYLYLRRTR